ncbi:hypothetical protein BO71DRAFT_402221 [Aspergillus ellipticus CBS 707.79]|uniref:Uncharacterized protein n=1 Tax=Aspergillus ellipticus CBS 707.79 TaxID=1448320 RepID=A0A319DQL0_9EURO|nr:hypothetical protein BO71DRAFT_402221 [Aspergillus ellipticus CBS 707.79]
MQPQTLLLGVLDLVDMGLALPFGDNEYSSFGFPESKSPSLINVDASRKSDNSHNSYSNDGGLLLAHDSAAKVPVG